jgi:hypothetical protein
MRGNEIIEEAGFVFGVANAAEIFDAGFRKSHG